MNHWLVLSATLPTQPSGLRVRVWRALKATGAGTLRDGVYILPEHAATAPDLWELERTIRHAGAQAHLLVVPARDAAQATAFEALFDRTDLYTELLQDIAQARAGLARDAEVSIRKGLRKLEQRWQDVQSTDFFAGKGARRVADALAAFRREVDLRFSPDEPGSTDARIERLASEDYQGRTWVTRARPWVDRLGTAWLIQRFIDRAPTFAWVSDTRAGMRKVPKSAVGYDFDGATFTHVGDKVSFEVVAESFGLLGDPALRRLAALVHAIDAGGLPVDEATGFELLMRGLQARHPDDDDLLAAALPFFDAAYAALQVPDDR